MTVPMYRRIAHDLRQRIQAGDLSPGEQLPTELELREAYDASRNTIRDAIKWLATNGLVESRAGQGTFVVERITPFVTTLSADPETGLGGGEGEAAMAEVRERGRVPSRSGPRVELLAATGNLATRLRVPEGTQVVSRHWERFIDGTPWSLQTIFYPMEFVQRGAYQLLEAKDIPHGSVAYLEETLGLTQVGYRDRILVRTPDENEIRFFRLPDDGRVPVISLMRTGYQASEQGPVPFRVAFTALPADRNQLVINSGEVPAARAAAARPLPATTA
ncbi:MAG TPA: GntR family transcriptional regulator [Streptosporangiaceae bacterium]|nr:GntR family transcriptional regulator [Streptosporangiaceae bacterium]